MSASFEDQLSESKNLVWNVVAKYGPITKDMIAVRSMMSVVQVDGALRNLLDDNKITYKQFDSQNGNAIPEIYDVTDQEIHRDREFRETPIDQKINKLYKIIESLEKGTFQVHGDVDGLTRAISENVKATHQMVIAQQSMVTQMKQLVELIVGMRR